MYRYFQYCALIMAILQYSCFSPRVDYGRVNNMKDKISSSLENDELKYWYPRVIDTVYGGYLSRYSFDWKEDSTQDKYLVYEARHLWTTSYLYQNYPERNEFLRYARHGFEFLRDHLWDDRFGGFYIAVDRKGFPLQENIREKRVYGQAFSLYALSQYYLVSQDTSALQLAKKEFLWMEENVHDIRYGGYWEFLYRNGKPIQEKDTVSSSLNDGITRGYKDYNSSIHLLEALSTLYKAWPDPLVKSRLEEMLNIINNSMINPKGYLIQFFFGDWSPVPADMLKQKAGKNLWYTDHITFGHDIETAFLLIEAAESLGINDSVVLPNSIRLTEHTLKYGWDKINGGIFDKGLYISPDSVKIIDDHKSWWAEVEALNTLLLMSIKVPAEHERYYNYFIEQWKYIDQYLIDHTDGEFYNYGIDTYPGNKYNMKGHGWKASYHTTRSLVNCIIMLDDLKRDD